MGFCLSPLVPRKTQHNAQRCTAAGAPWHSPAEQPRGCVPFSCGRLRYPRHLPSSAILFLFLHIYVCNPLIASDQLIWRFQLHLQSKSSSLCLFFPCIYVGYTGQTLQAEKRVTALVQCWAWANKPGLSLCQSTNWASSCLPITCRINTHRGLKWSQRASSFSCQLKYPHFDPLGWFCSLRKGPLKFKNYFI